MDSDGPFDDFDDFDDFDNEDDSDDEDDLDDAEEDLVESEATVGDDQYDDDGNDGVSATADGDGAEASTPGAVARRAKTPTSSIP